MTPQELLNLSLVFHIIGLTTVAGSNLVTFVMQAQFWKQYEQDKEKGVAVMAATSKIMALIGIGFLLLILSGISMLAITQGLFAQQFWFKVKMIILLAIIVNGLAFGRKNGLLLNRIVKDDMTGKDQALQLKSVRRRINIFYLMQFAFFITIFVLSVFKFN